MKHTFLLATLFLSLLLVARAKEPAELTAARKEFEQVSPTTEAARLRLVERLAKLTADFFEEYQRTGDKKRSDELQAVYTELRKHPIPKESDARALSRLRAGKWDSFRHSYLFRTNGTWTMLPEEKETTHGTWRIEGNQFYDSAATEPVTKSQYTIVFLNERYFIFMDKEVVFFEMRPK